MDFFGYGILGLVYTVLFIWALVDLITSGRRGTDMILWLLIILVLPVLGSILYLILARRGKGLTS